MGVWDCTLDPPTVRYVHPHICIYGLHLWHDLLRGARCGWPLCPPPPPPALPSNCRFTPKLSKVSYVGGDGLDVLVAVAYGGTVLLWPWEKFSARLTYMTDRWQEHDAAVQKNETLPPLAPLDVCVTGR